MFSDCRLNLDRIRGTIILRSQVAASTCFGQINKSTHSLPCQIIPIWIKEKIRLMDIRTERSIKTRKWQIDPKSPSWLFYSEAPMTKRSNKCEFPWILLKVFLTNYSRIHPRWWSGGVSGAVAQFFTTPFDLIESRMVIIKKDRGMASSLQHAIRTDGNFQAHFSRPYYHYEL